MSEEKYTEFTIKVTVCTKNGHVFFKNEKKSIDDRFKHLKEFVDAFAKYANIDTDRDQKVCVDSVEISYIPTD